jgi:hypothetical protein
MDEGVDPTDMCQSLVYKVAQSKQLMAVTDPDIMVLFDNWLEELEEEVVSNFKRHPQADTLTLAEDLGLSKSGADFLVAKLQREKKI